MAIQHDNQGFLVGDLVEGSKNMLAGQGTTNRLLGGIKTDVSAIARTLGAASRGGRASGGGGRTVAEPAGRGNSSHGGAPGARSPGSASMSAQQTGGFGVANARATVAPGGRSARGRFIAKAVRNDGGTGIDSIGTANIPTVMPTERDGQGRFVAGSGGAGKLVGVEGAGGSRLLDKLGSVADAIKGMAGGGDQIDPSLTAMKELKDVVEPIGRGAFALLGRTGAQKKERWYQKIWKSLTNIEKKPMGGGGGGGGGDSGGGILGGLFNRMFGGLFTSLQGVLPLIGSLFTKVLGPIAALWGAFELGQWVGKKIYEWLDASGIMSKVFDIFDAMSTGISGAWTTATDGFIKALDFLKSIPDRIGGVFDAIDQGIRKIPVIGDLYAKASDAAKNTAADVKKGYNEGKSGDSSVPSTSTAPVVGRDGRNVNDPRRLDVEAPVALPPATSAAQAAGRDVGKVVGAVVGVGTQAKAGYDVARGKPTDAPAPSGAVQSLARGAGGAVGTGANWVLGQTSQRYESGKGGAGTVSTGKGDNGGASYGTYQMSSKMGVADKFIGGSAYADQFKGLKAGTPEFDAKWKDIAKSDPAFGSAQHDFIKETHFDPAMAGLKKGGIDLSGRGSAVQDSLWSTSVQFGAEADKGKKGAIPMFQKALAGKDVSKMSDPEIVSAIQDYKLANNDALFKNSSDGVRSSTANRASSEKTALLGLNSTTQVASAPSYVAQAIPSSVPVKMPAMPEVNMPAPSTDRAAPTVVSIRQPIGQDMGDRGIAHIVSGGMGG